MCRRYGSDPVLPWLWHRLAAVALIGPLACEPPYAGAALKKPTTTKKYAQMPKYMTSFDSVIPFMEMRPKEMVGQVHDDSTTNILIPAQHC